MIKAFLMLDDFLYIVVIIGLILYALSLRRRMAGLNDPELWLTRKERHARALEKLEAEDAELRRARLLKDMEIINGTTTTHKENTL